MILIIPPVKRHTVIELMVICDNGYIGKQRYNLAPGNQQTITVTDVTNGMMSIDGVILSFNRKRHVRMHAR